LILGNNSSQSCKIPAAALPPRFLDTFVLPVHYKLHFFGGFSRKRFANKADPWTALGFQVFFFFPLPRFPAADCSMFGRSSD